MLQSWFLSVCPLPAVKLNGNQARWIAHGKQSYIILYYYYYIPNIYIIYVYVYVCGRARARVCVCECVCASPDTPA